MRGNVFSLVLAICVSLLYAGDAAAPQPLSTEFVSVKVEKNRKSYDVYLVNHASFDITATLDMHLSNLLASRPLPLTLTLRGHEQKKCLRLRLADKGLAGSYQSTFRYTIGNRNAEPDTAYLYRLPYKKGSAHRVVQGYFGAFSHSKTSHYAVDFSMLEGTEIYAAREGVVVGAYELSDIGGPSADFMDFTNYIFIRHPDLTIGAYYHLKQYGVLVRIGQKVQRGQLIGYSGSTGFTLGPHLHFEVFTAVSGTRQEGVPLKFETLSGVVRQPLEGWSYIAK